MKSELRRDLQMVDARLDLAYSHLRAGVREGRWIEALEFARQVAAQAGVLAHGLAEQVRGSEEETS